MRLAAKGPKAHNLAMDLLPLLLAPASDVLRSGPHRDTFAWQIEGGETIIVKRYSSRRVGEAVRQRLLGRDSSSPGEHEYEVLCSLRELQIRVPRPLGTCTEGPRSLVAMERLAPLVTLREHLTANPQAAEDLLPRVLDLVTRFHGAGWYHRDLYLDHLVLAGAGEELYLIDLERARRDPRPRRRWFVKDLAALWHSTPAAVSGRSALRFLSRWLDAHGVDGRRARRGWLRSVLAKERRMAAHTPRGGTSF
jgi:tRNA A-37 threonylcarbamoyl transferase component Bud32